MLQSLFVGGGGWGRAGTNFPAMLLTRGGGRPQHGAIYSSLGNTRCMLFSCHKIPDSPATGFPDSFATRYLFLPPQDAWLSCLRIYSFSCHRIPDSLTTEYLTLLLQDAWLSFYRIRHFPVTGHQTLLSQDTWLSCYRDTWFYCHRILDSFDTWFLNLVPKDTLHLCHRIPYSLATGYLIILTLVIWLPCPRFVTLLPQDTWLSCHRISDSFATGYLTILP